MNSIQNIHSLSKPLSYQNNDNRTIIEISQSAINNNIAYYKKHIGTHNHLALVIKGNGYGHGLTTIGLIAEKNETINWLCVAHYEEALALMQAGVTKNILVMGHIFNTSVFLPAINIHFMVDSIEYAQFLNEQAQCHSQQIPIHIKVDTGLSRFGITPFSIKNFIQQLKKLSYLKITGIFSHFISSNDNATVTHKQFTLFCDTIEAVLPSFNTTPYVHMSNTGSITELSYPSYFNFFRVGLGLYGFGNDANFLQPALTWKTYIIAIKTIPAHSYVSYACTYKTTRTTRIALLPVGYDDGYQLRFSNKTLVLINNNYAPVIGRIGMNITIVDITNCNTTIGDEVILIGFAEKIRIPDLAKAADIYNIREIFTGINAAIKRIVI